MPTILYRLNHYHPLDSLGYTDRVGYNSKTIGNYSSVEAAARAHQAVADAEGFRDWPDGYRLHEYVVDQPFFRGGFEPHPEGDLAIAGDSSGDVGNDDEVEERGSVPPLSPDEPLYGDPDLAHGPRQGGLWELSHYKIGVRSDEAFMETGGKVVGLFSTAEKAKAAIAALRDKPGFKLWPGGWRISPSDIDDVGWEDGFVTETWLE